MPLHFAAEEYAAGTQRTRAAHGRGRPRCAAPASSRRACTGSPATTRSGSASSSASCCGPTGGMVLLTRAPDLRQAQLTSTLEDVRVWVDRRRAPIRRSSCGGCWQELGLARQAAGGGVGDARADGGQRQAARGGARRLRAAGGRVAAAVAAAAGEVGGGAGRTCGGRRELADAALAAAIEHTRAGGRRGRDPGPDARCGVRGRRRLSGQPVHHRLGPGGAARAATIPGGAGSIRWTSSRSSSPASTGSTMPA